LPAVPVAIGKVANWVAEEALRTIGESLSALIRLGEWKLFEALTGRHFIAQILDLFAKAEQDENAGLSAKGILDIFWYMVEWTVALSVIIEPELVDELLLEMIQEGFTNAIQTSVGGAFQTMLNVYRGASPPPTDYARDIAQEVESVDAKTLSLIWAMTGFNYPTLTFDILRGLHLQLDEKARDTYNQILDIIREWNDYTLTFHRLLLAEARARFSRTVEFVEDAIERAYSVTERIVNQHLARVNEFLDSLEGLRRQYDAGMIDEETLAIESRVIHLEALGSKEAYDSYISEIETFISKAREEVDSYVNQVLSELPLIYEEIAAQLTKPINAGVNAFNAWLEVMLDKVTEALAGVRAYRNIREPTRLSTEFIYVPPTPEYSFYAEEMVINGTVNVAVTSTEFYGEELLISGTVTAVNVSDRYRAYEGVINGNVTISVTGTWSYYGEETVLNGAVTADVTEVPPSGLDPYDPLWLPEEGWTSVYHFDKPEEVNEAFNEVDAEATVAASILKVKGVESGPSAVIRSINTAPKKIALTIRGRYKYLPEQKDCVWFEATIGHTWHRIRIYYGANTNFYVVDDVTGEAHEIGPFDDWYVAVFDLDAGRVKVYDKNKDLIVDMAMGNGYSEDYKYHYEIGIYAHYSGAYPLTDVWAYTDWIALLEPVYERTFSGGEKLIEGDVNVEVTAPVYTFEGYESVISGSVTAEVTPVTQSFYGEESVITGSVTVEVTWASFEGYENVITGSVTVEVTAAPTNASGLDPNDPTWAPTGGWDKIWEFRTEDELNDFANKEIKNASVENDRIVFSPPSGDYGIAEREVLNTVLKKAAVCLKVSVSSAQCMYEISYVSMDDGSYEWNVGLNVAYQDVTKLILYDEGYEENSATFDNPNDWLVVVWDYESKVVKVYDKNKNVIAQVNMSESESLAPRYLALCREWNDVDGVTTDVEVDWIAVKYA